jgi:hypothetical protein
MSRWTTLLVFSLAAAGAVPASAKEVASPCPPGETVAQVGDDLVLISEDLTVGPCEEIDGDVVVLSGDAHIAGRVSGDVVVVFGDLQLDPLAQIGGDAVVAGGALNQAPESKVQGDTGELPQLQQHALGVSAWLARPEVPSVASKAPSIEVDGERTLSSPFTGQPAWLRVTTSLLACLLVFLVGHFFLWLAPERARNLRRTIEAAPGTSLLMGSIVSVALSLVSIVLFISIIGWVALPFVGLGAALVAALGMGGLLEAIGDRLPLPVRLRSRSADLIGGCILLSLLSCVTVVGGPVGTLGALVLAAMFVAAIGAAVLSSLGGRAYS